MSQELILKNLKPERREQVLFVQWFRRTFPGQLVLSVPNGGSRNPREMIWLKAEGLTPGVPDLFVPGLGLWLEFKSATGRLSSIQVTVCEQLRGCGYRVEVVRSKDEAAQICLDMADASSNWSNLRFVAKDESNY
jgi:hypothetical protein